MMFKYLFITIFSLLMFVFQAVSQASDEGSNPFSTLKDKQSIVLMYNVYSSGFRVAMQQISISRIKDQIYIQNNTKTTGVVDYVNNADFKVEVIEAIKKDKNIPIAFRASSESGSIFVKKSKSYINYKNNNQVDSYKFIPIEGIDEEDIPSEYRREDISVSTNWMSFLTAIAASFKKDPLACNFEANMFDVTSGNKIKLSSPKKINIPEYAYTKYTGPAIQCKTVITPLIPINSSQNPKVVNSNIHIAEIIDDIFLPIKFVVNNQDLTLIIHLEDYHITSLSDFKSFDLIPEIPIPDVQ